MTQNFPRSTRQPSLTPAALDDIFITAFVPLTTRQKQEMALYLLRLIGHSLGLKASEPPYNSHKDVMRRYVQEVFGIRKFSLRELITKAETMSGEPSMKPSVLILVKNAINLPPRSSKGLCNPYFKIKVQGSSTPSFTSIHIKKTVDPNWNCLVNLAIEENLVRTNGKIICEIWDKLEFFSDLKKILRVHSWKKFATACKNFFDFLISLFSGSFRDEKIGQVSVTLNQIPAIDRNVIANLRDVSPLNSGVLSMTLVWGSQVGFEMDSKKLFQHVRILRYLILWHSNQLLTDLALTNSQMKERTKKSIKVQFPSLFYVAALTLINQHRIYLNLSMKDNETLCHCVASLLLEEQIKESAPIPLRIILLSYIASLELFRVSNRFQNSVSEVFYHCHEGILERLFKLYLVRFGPLFERIIHGETESYPAQEFLLFLRVFDKYSRVIRGPRFRQRLNLILNKVVLDHLQATLKRFTHWEQTITELEKFNDLLNRYWNESLGPIMGEAGLNKVRTLFYDQASQNISNILLFWERDPIKYHDLLIQTYCEVSRFNRLLFTNIVTGEDPSNFVQVVKEIVLEKSPKKLVFRPHTKRSVIDHFKNFGPAYEKVGTEPADKDFINFLPSSIAGFVEKATDRLQTKSEGSILSGKDIDLGSDFRFKEKINSIPGLMGVFPTDIETKWLPHQFQLLKNSTAKTARSEIARAKNESFKASTKVVDDLYYEALAETLYRFAEFASWDEVKFNMTFELFLECMKSFCNSLFEEGRKMVENDEEKSGNFYLFMVNALSFVRDKCLRKDLVELITDTNANEIWRWFIFTTSLAAVDVGKQATSMENLTLKFQSSEMLIGAKVVGIACIKINALCETISALEEPLLIEMSKRFLIYIHDLMNEEVFVKDAFLVLDDKGLKNIASRFEASLTKILAMIDDNVCKVNFLYAIKCSLSKNFSTIATNLKNSSKNHEDLTLRKISRLKLIKLSVIVDALKEILMNYIRLLDIVKAVSELRSSESLATLSSEMKSASSENISKGEQPRKNTWF